MHSSVYSYRKTCCGDGDESGFCSYNRWEKLIWSRRSCWRFIVYRDNPQLLHCQTAERISLCSWRDAVISATPALHDINEASERALMHSGTQGQDVYFYTDISTVGVRGTVLNCSPSWCPVRKITFKWASRPARPDKHQWNTAKLDKHQLNTS